MVAANMTTYVREDTVENYLVGRVKELGGVAYKFTSPGRKGVPDRMCCFPEAQMFFVETKAPKGGLLGASQHREIRRLHTMGFHVYVATTKRRVDVVLAREEFV